MYEGDPSKNRTNQSKQGIAFEETLAVLENPNAVTIDDSEEEEERQVTVGMDGYGRILVVVYTWRGENIRIISARKVTKLEMNEYERQL